MIRTARAGVDSTPSAPTSPFPWDGGRDPAVDLLRGAAVICMIIAHVRVWAPVSSEPVKIALVMINNVASPLFAIVMGISAGIVLTRQDKPVVGWVFVARNVIRGLILIVIGMALELLGTFVAIVLMSLGATLVVAAPLALLPIPAVGSLAVVVFAVGPFVNAVAREARGPVYAQARSWFDPLLDWIVLSGHYRVVSLLPFVLAGVVLARLRLTNRAAIACLGTGVLAGVVVVALRLAGHGLGVSEVVSGSVPDAMLDVALAASACGFIVLGARWAPMRPVITALAPVRATGAMALTAYVLHVGLIALVRYGDDPMAPYEQWALYGGGIFLGTLVVCWVWWQLLGKGPIERAMGLVTDRIG